MPSPLPVQLAVHDGTPQRLVGDIGLPVVAAARAAAGSVGRQLQHTTQHKETEGNGLRHEGRWWSAATAASQSGPAPRRQPNNQPFSRFTEALSALQQTAPPTCSPTAQHTSTLWERSTHTPPAPPPSPGLRRSGSRPTTHTESTSATTVPPRHAAAASQPAAQQLPPPPPPSPGEHPPPPATQPTTTPSNPSNTCRCASAWPPPAAPPSPGQRQPGSHPHNPKTPNMPGHSLNCGACGTVAARAAPAPPPSPVCVDQAATHITPKLQHAQQ